jgi:hypothetical protein
MTRGPTIMAALVRAKPLANPTRACRGGVVRMLRLTLMGLVIPGLFVGLTMAV